MKKSTLIYLSVCLLIIIVSLAKKGSENKESEIVEWNSPDENITLGFFVGKSGHLYFEGRMNGTSGLFLFDTGAENSVLNEKYITDKDLKLDSLTIRDAKDLLQTRNLYKVPYLELGAFKIKDLIVYPADSLSWKDPKGAFYKQDSVIGVIGNNIISKFIWDFDMVNRRVTVSNSKAYCDTIPDSLAFELVSVEKHKEILVRINGKLKRFTLDFGSFNPISLSGPIPNKEEADKKNSFSQDTKSALNHLNPNQDKADNFHFADVKFGDYEFKEIKCMENNHISLLGIPFVWSFKRVVIDYTNNKAYFIGYDENASDFGVVKFNRESFIYWEGAKIFNSKPEGMKFIFKQDSIDISYTCYGKLTVYNNRDKMDSINVSDSIRFPDGKIKPGPVTLVMDSID
ncbi:MAG TPA: hypothetical protein VFG54_11230 [Prolixibacteraceae bacterium]|nr:hypothetical protein [Prolixibacteraceae bacterium]